MLCGAVVRAARRGGSIFARPVVTAIRASSAHGGGHRASTTAAQRDLVSVQWLREALDKADGSVEGPHLRPVDGTLYLDDTPVAPRGVPGARFFDIDAISDASTGLPHSLPPPRVLASGLHALGIGPDDTVVAYDQHGMFSAARVWWMLRSAGFKDVRLLDGGLPRWAAEGGAIEEWGSSSPTPSPLPAGYTVDRWADDMRRDAKLVVSAEQVAKALPGTDSAEVPSDAMLVLDARSAGRFTAAEPEPRAGMRGGHMPGARNVHYASLIDQTTQCFLPPNVLRGVFERAGVDVDRPGPIVTSCGSGVTACVVTFALSLCGRDVFAGGDALFDGSWSEWGLPDPDGTRPVVK